MQNLRGESSRGRSFATHSRRGLADRSVSLGGRERMNDQQVAEKLLGVLRQVCYVDVKPIIYEASFFLMTLLLPDQRETCCYAWHGTGPSHLLGMRPSLRHKAPGSLSQGSNRSGSFLSRFCLSSSRSLGRCLLLGQRSRMNLFSHLIRSLLHQDHRNPHAEFARHCNNGDPGRHLAGMALANRAEKFSKLAIFSNRRPRGLNELTSKPPIAGMGDRSPIGFISGGVLHGNQTQKASQLADVFKLAPIADPRQKLAGHDPTDPRDRHHILNALRQFGVGLTKAADLFGALKNLFLGKLQTVKQLIELKAHRVRTGKLSELCLYDERPLAAGWSRGKGNPLEEQQRLNPLLHPHRLTHHRIAKLSEVTKLAI